MSATRINLSWTGNATTADGYYIEQSTDGTTGWVQISVVSMWTSSYTATGPFNGATTYYYRIRAHSYTGGDSAYATASATTPGFPNQPTLNTAVAQSDRTVALRWSDVAGATGFRIERFSWYSTVTVPWTTVGTVAAGVTSFTNGGLLESTSYAYRITATNASGDSAASVPRGVRTLTNYNPSTENHAPVAVGDQALTSYRQPVNIDVLFNSRYTNIDAYGDDDFDGDPIDIQSAQDGEHGTVKIMRPGDEGYDADATSPPGRSYVVYTPAPGFFGNDAFQYTIKDDEDAMDSATVVVSVRLPLTLQFFIDSGPNADDRQGVIAAEVTLGDVDFVNDGVTINWRVVSVSDGTLDQLQTTTTSRFSSNILITSGKAGDIYQVFARVVEVALDGGPVRSYGYEISSDPLIVDPGKPAQVDFEVDDDRLPADGKSETRITITARDAAGNLVADGTPVAWGLIGLGALSVMDDVTWNGKASATLRSSIHAGTQNVLVSVDGYETGADVESLPLVIALGITGNVLTLGGDAAQTVTATVTDVEGHPVANGTPITWYAQKGSIMGQAVVIGGSAQAMLTARGGSQIPGVGAVRAFVGSRAGAADYLWIGQPNVLSIQAQHSVIAGDATADGSYPVDQADGGTIDRPYFAGTDVTVSLADIPILAGIRNAVIAITVGDPGGEGADLITVNGQAGPTTITLNAQGQGAFRLQSTGGLAPGRITTLPIMIQVQQEWWETLLFPGLAPRITLNLNVQPRELIAKTLEFVGNLGWGAFAGEGDSVTEIAGDIGFSLIPVVGAFTDGRDVGKELVKLWPGGESPDWYTFSFAVIGVATSIAGPEVDWLPLLWKQMSKVMDMSKGVGKTVLHLAMHLEFAKLNELKSLLFKLADPTFARFRDLAQDLLVKNSDDLTRLNRIVEGLGERGAEEAADFFTVIKGAGGLGEAAAQKVLAVLGELNPSQIADIKAAGSLDEVAEAVGRYSMKPDRLREYTEWLAQRKLDPNAPIPFGSDADRAIDELLRSEGREVAPNLLAHEVVGGRAGQQGDRVIDGVKTDYKTDVFPQSDSIMNSLNKKQDQASAFIFDMRGKNMSRDQARLTTEMRLPNAPFTKNGKVKMVRIIADGWEVNWP